jgi:hypothetical protein
MLCLSRRRAAPQQLRRATREALGISLSVSLSGPPRRPLVLPFLALSPGSILLWSAHQHNVSSTPRGNLSHLVQQVPAADQLLYDKQGAGILIVLVVILPNSVTRYNVPGRGGTGGHGAKGAGTRGLVSAWQVSGGAGSAASFRGSKAGGEDKGNAHNGGTLLERGLRRGGSENAKEANAGMAIVLCKPSRIFSALRDELWPM